MPTPTPWVNTDVTSLETKSFLFPYVNILSKKFFFSAFVLYLDLVFLLSFFTGSAVAPSSSDKESGWTAVFLLEAQLLRSKERLNNKIVVLQMYFFIFSSLIFIFI